MFRKISMIVSLVLAGLLTLSVATSVHANEAKLTVDGTVIGDCGEVIVTFVNNTIYPFSGDIRVGDEPGTDDEVTGMNISKGPFAGQPFGQRYRTVEISANSTIPVQLSDVDGEISFRIWRGPENDWYVPWDSVIVPACPDPTTDPDPIDCVDINTADAEELTLLKHINAQRAEQIIELRPFSSTQDIVDRVSGIGPVNILELIAGGGDFLPLCDIVPTSTPTFSPTPPATPGAPPVQGTGDQELPVTGSRVAGLVIGGLLLGGLGTGMVWLTRRRKNVIHGYTGDADLQ